MGDVNVEVEYCGGCGYLPKFQELSDKIRESVPSANVTGKEGRTGSFEVSVNGQLIYSKLRTMAFPDFQNVTDIVNDAAAGREIKSVDKQQPINCIIL
ncbi:migration and invasion enhancer 1 [Schistocerca americana]|uniref:migration and invasion enhancer 1 n=1 Tax=Schistocerca americana TaxID=7009 RepID=UPI001F4F4DBB|nr:migration and invasion enhancer 1 [Schistocerca americana]XP_047100625.1 migration and invasion enhancer 1 [Schistocerca piceifrons]XP_049770680.1 migration and invasion enhancer 1 [Schistocerca cancellata]XP_049797855.1 migration and invasion enhancer 1 [Schistocerca nitens]XP_049945986.1 migration and invasion enhancer 1 [Schistocerca serialis cubense]